MTSQSCLEDLISSFKITCSSLERKAELKLKDTEKKCGEEFASNVKALQKFDEIVSGISKTCSEVINNNDILKHATEKNINKNSINIPYEIHADIVKCISELYNGPAIMKEPFKEKLIDERNVQLVHELIKVGQKNVHDVNDVESTLIESKEMF